MIPRSQSIYRNRSKRTAGKGNRSYPFKHTIYVRKSFEGERKWLPIGDLKTDGNIDLWINYEEIQAIIRKDRSVTSYWQPSYMSSEDRKILKKLFKNKQRNQVQICYQIPGNCKNF